MKFDKEQGHEIAACRKCGGTVDCVRPSLQEDTASKQLAGPILGGFSGKAVGEVSCFSC